MDSSMSEWSFWRDPFVQDNGALIPQFLQVDGNFLSQQELPNASEKKQSRQSNAIQQSASLALDIFPM